MDEAHNEWAVDFIVEDDEDIKQSEMTLLAMHDDLESFVRRHADLTPYKTPPRTDLDLPEGAKVVSVPSRAEPLDHGLPEDALRECSPVRDTPPTTPSADDEDKRRAVIDMLLATRRRELRIAPALQPAHSSDQRNRLSPVLLPATGVPMGTEDLVSSRSVSPAAAVVAAAAVAERRLTTTEGASDTDAPPTAPIASALDKFYGRGHLSTPKTPNDIRDNSGELVRLILRASEDILRGAQGGCSPPRSESPPSHSVYAALASRADERPPRCVTPPQLLMDSCARGVSPQYFNSAPYTPEAAQPLVSPSQMPQYVPADTPEAARLCDVSRGIFVPQMHQAQEPSMTRFVTRVASASPQPQPPAHHTNAPPQQALEWKPPRANARVALLGPDVRRAATKREKRFDDTVAPASIAAVELIEHVRRQQGSVLAEAYPPPPVALPLRAIASMRNASTSRSPPSAGHRGMPSTSGGDDVQLSMVQTRTYPPIETNVVSVSSTAPAPLPHLSLSSIGGDHLDTPNTPGGGSMSPNRMALRRRSVTFVR